jgi:hypothetical protein
LTFGVASGKLLVFASPGRIPLAETEQPRYLRDIRFCPYCFQQTFDMAEVQGEWAYCEICGVDIETKELIRS